MTSRSSSEYKQPAIKRRISIKTRALNCHKMMQKDLSPKSDHNVQIDKVGNEELEGVILDSVLRSRSKHGLSHVITEVDVAELYRYICVERFHDLIVIEKDTNNVEEVIENYSEQEPSEEEEQILENSEEDTKKNADKKLTFSVMAINIVVEEEVINAGRKVSFGEQLNIPSSSAILNSPYDYAASLFNIPKTNSSSFENLLVDVYCEKGNRQSMEDRIVALSNLQHLFSLNLPDSDSDCKISFLAVYDGHSGSSASEYCRIHLHANIFKIARDKLRNEGNGDLVSILKESIAEGYAVTDEQFIKLAASRDLNSGTTALCVIVIQSLSKKTCLLVANAGDSQVVLSPTGDQKAKILCKIHKPDVEEEKKRVIRAGGNVYHWYGQARVNGVLNVSRSIGDRKYKPNIVIHKPDIVECEIDHGKGQFLVLGSDGLWDGLNAHDSCALVTKLLFDQKRLPTDNRLSRALVRECMNKSKDNISAMVLLL